MHSSSSTAAGAPEIGSLAAAEREQAARLLAAAFRDNPLNRSVIVGGARRRLRSNLHGSRASLAVAQAPGSAALVLGARRGASLVAVLLAMPPDHYPPPLPSAWTQIRCLLGQGWRTAIGWGRVHAALHAVHPREPHWYLDLLGVEPAAQRSGLGGALLRAWLERVDADRTPSYLETDRRANVDFYAREGFEVIGELVVADVVVWQLWREARGIIGRTSSSCTTREPITRNGGNHVRKTR